MEVMSSMMIVCMSSQKQQKIPKVVINTNPRPNINHLVIKNKNIKQIMNIITI